MRANFDRVITVPIEPDTIRKTVHQLPRQPEDANIVAVQLKRKLELKNTHLQEYIRPKLLVEALRYLKKNNVFYHLRQQCWPSISPDGEEEDDDDDVDDKGCHLSSMHCKRRRGCFSTNHHHQQST